MRIICVTVFCLLGCIAYAQQQNHSLTAIHLQDVSAFSNPAKNWKIVGQTSGSFANDKLKAIGGKGILFNDFKEGDRYTPGTNLFTLMQHSDIILSFDFVMPKGSNSGIYLQGRYEIQLFDSWGIAKPKSSDCGSIYERWNDALAEGMKGYEGHPARTNACLAPGLWQHLEIEFQAPRFDEAGKKVQPARFVRVMLNGIVVQENVVLSGPTRAAAFTDEKASGPLMFQGDHGQVAFRNMEYALLNEFKPVLSDMQYEYYEGNFHSFEQVTPDKLTHKGSVDAIDSRVADNPNKMCLIFSGKISVSENSNYQFTMRKHGMGKLEVDGNEIIKPGNEFGDISATIDLTPGTHAIKLFYSKNFSWASTGVGLFISKVNARPFPLHVPGSLPKTTLTPVISVKASASPELIRSFAEFNGKKRTHVISVGDGSGIHYMYDLQQAALLRTWHGEFLNVTDMWHERGEPQTALAFGAAVSQTGRCPLALLSNEKSPMPDSLDEKSGLKYRSTTLDDKGYPTFHYLYKGLIFEDAMVPNSSVNGIKRTLTLKNLPSSETLMVRMGEGNQIEEVAENIFSVDSRYYIHYIPEGKSKPTIRKSGDKAELIVEYSSKIDSTISYTIIW